MHLKINTEMLTFAIVQQAARLVCLASHPYEIRFAPRSHGPKFTLPRIHCFTGSKGRVLIESHEFPPIRVFQIPSALTENFRFYLANTYRKMYLLFNLFYFNLFYSSLDFDDECLKFSMALAKSRSENILGLFHKQCCGRL